MKLSYNTLRNLLRPVLLAKLGEGYITDVFDDAAIYSVYSREGTEKACYKVPFSIDKDRKVTLGAHERVQEVTTYEKVASFTLEREGATFSADGMVVREGKVFECGSYPDKNFELTEDEADEIVASFTPVDNDLEHMDTILSGELGELRGLERRGSELVGKVAIPEWLDKLVGKKPLPVSLAFDSAKRVKGNALTLSPRITDAAVFAAFRQARPEIAPEPTESPASKKEVAKDPGGKPKMKLSDFLAFFGIKPDAKPDDEIAFTAPAPERSTEPSAKSANELQLEAELARLRGEANQTRLARVDELAAQFADETIRANKAVPAEKDSLVALFKTSAIDDAKGELVKFSDDGKLVEGDRVKQLRAAIDARIPHELTQEQIASLEEATTFSGERGERGKPDPKRIDELVKSTSLGRALSQ